MEVRTTREETLDSVHQKYFQKRAASRLNPYNESPSCWFIGFINIETDPDMNNSRSQMIEQQQSHFDDINYLKQNETTPDVSKQYNIWDFLIQTIDSFQDWSDEDIQIGPIDKILHNVKELIPELIANNLIPSRITPSAEEGLCLIFREATKAIYVEFYNDGDIGLISEDFVAKKILDNIDLKEDEVVSTLSALLS